MADEPNNIVTPPTGTVPTPPESGNQQDFDSSKIPDEQFNNIFKDSRIWTHPRFKELIDSKNELKTLKDEQKKADDDRLKQQGEFEKLAKQKEEEASQLREQLNNTKLDSDIREFARQLGAVDTSAVLKLIDRSGLSIDSNGQVVGAKEAVEKLLEASPFLKGNNTPSVGSPSNPAGEGAAPARRFTGSQLQDTTFYQKNRDAILHSMKLGLIDMDK